MLKLYSVLFIFGILNAFIFISLINRKLNPWTKYETERERERKRIIKFKMIQIRSSNGVDDYSSSSKKLMNSIILFGINREIPQ